MLTSKIISGSGNIRHGFFTRRGGVSFGLYESLNCGLGSGDDPGRVRTNRARAMDRLGVRGEALLTASQVHSGRAATVKEPWPTSHRPEVDGLVTRTPGIAIGVLAADCVPVLLADGEAGVIGAAHAGWKGAHAGIIEATVGAMLAEGADVGRITAALGPSIGFESYEVGAEFQASFMADSADNERFFVASETREGHFRFDLGAYVIKRLAATGIKAVEKIEADTYADERRFFSFRRATHRGEKGYGRNLSAIVLTG